MLGRKRKINWKLDGIYATKLLAQRAVIKLRKEGYEVRGYQNKKTRKWIVKYRAN